jgi:biotin carboxyl carrier protein
MSEKYETFRVYIAEYKTLLTEKYIKNLKWRPPDKNKVYAIIPGTILEICVKEGKKLKAGETILWLEAMKMNNAIIMPFDGTVKKITVSPGQRVSKNEILAEIKPDH